MCDCLSIVLLFCKAQLKKNSPGDLRESSAPWWEAPSGTEAKCRGLPAPPPTRPGPENQFPEKLNASLELTLLHPQRRPWTPLHPLPVKEGKPPECGVEAALEMQRLGYLKGMHWREVSPGFPFAFKEEQSLSETLYKDREFRGSGPWAQRRLLPRRCYANLA